MAGTDPRITRWGFPPVGAAWCPPSGVADPQPLQPGLL